MIELIDFFITLCTLYIKVNNIKSLIFTLDLNSPKFPA